MAIGKSMGSGYWSIDPVSYQAVTVAPHSEYIQEYLRVGVVGAFSFYFRISPFLKLWRLGRHTQWRFTHPRQHGLSSYWLCLSMVWPTAFGRMRMLLSPLQMPSL